MSPQDFRKLALSFEGAVESSHMGVADFRGPKGIFATLGYPDAAFAMVKLTPDQQELMLAAETDVFRPVPGGWGRKGSTLAVLEVLDEPTALSALTMAWNNRLAG